ncbi:MAG: hypothetical protein ABIP78_13030 [Pyrinomonadaceae bacterium]
MVFLYEEGTGQLTATQETYDADAEKWTFPLYFDKNAPGTCLPLMSEKTGTLFCLLAPEQFADYRQAYVRMPPAVAANNNKKIQIAFVGRLVLPHVEESYSVAATSSSPRIEFDLKEIICLNPKTGVRWNVEFEKTAKIITVESKPTATPKPMATPPPRAERKALVLGPTEAQTEVQSTIKIIAEAIAHEDFSSFRESLALAVRDARTETILNEDFRHLLRSQIRNALVLRALNNVNPILSSEPLVQSSSNGSDYLTVTGTYPAVSGLTTTFYFKYVKEDGIWKLFFYDLDIK